MCNELFIKLLFSIVKGERKMKSARKIRDYAGVNRDWEFYATIKKVTKTM